MSQRDIADVLADRASQAGLSIPDSLSRRLIAYFQLLERWNRTINLTSLSDPEEAVDRLLLEPVAAATHLQPGADVIDLGTGGGSPAVPLALALGSSRLVMVESRVRKAAFLREVARELGLGGSVETSRFEDVAADRRFVESFGIASVRAVRLDDVLFDSVHRLLRPLGQAVLFRSLDAPEPPPGLPSSLRWVASHRLIPASRSALTVLEKCST